MTKRISNLIIKSDTIGLFLDEREDNSEIKFDLNMGTGFFNFSALESINIRLQNLTINDIRMVIDELQSRIDKYEISENINEN